LNGWQDLSEQEARRLKRLLQLDSKTIERLEKVASEDEKMEWLWASARRVFSTIAIVVGGVYMLWEHLKNLVRGLLGQ